jgi:hypothetical protein
MNANLLRPVLWVFMVLAGAGLVASAAVHVAVWLGAGIPEPFLLLHLGVFIVWLPTVLVSTHLTREFKQKDLWKAALRGAPRWMRRTQKALIALAGLNFVLFFLQHPPGRSESGPGPEDARVFSAFWMVFYGTAFAILYSALHVNEGDDGRQCRNGHRVSPIASFCEECGAPVAERRLVR